MEARQAADMIVALAREGRQAGGYLVCGDVKTQGAEMVMDVLMELFPSERRQVAAKTHPDVFWLEPQGKSRTIKAERPRNAPSGEGPGMRDGLIAPIAETAYAGGWRVGVIAGADRMQEAAANAFLKTLEEPPPKSIFFLLTDSPASIMPTIVSRCHRIDLPSSTGTLPEGNAAEIEAAFLSPMEDKGSLLARSRAASALASILAALEDAAPDGDAPIVRKAFFRTVLSVPAGWMRRGELPVWKSARNIEAVEDAYRQTSRYISGETAVAGMMDRIFFP